MKCSLISLSAAVALTASASAGNIVYVSFHEGDNTPSSGAAGAGFTQAPDVGYTQLLASQGHNVSRFVTHNDPTVTDLAVLNAADLVILGRSVNSGHYQQANETAFWNTQVTAPMLVTGGYPLRSSRLNYFTGTDIPDSTGDTRLVVSNTAHPIFNGVALDGSNTMVNSYNMVVAGQRGTSINTNAPANGTVLASFTADGFSAPGTGAIIEWPAGAILNNGQVLAGPRLVMFTGSREASNVSSETSGIYDLYADGETMFLNAVNYMIPEPSAALLAGLAGLGALFIRRRRS